MANTLTFEIGYELCVARYALRYVFTGLAPCECCPTPNEDICECYFFLKIRCVIWLR